ncbi:hypothetical protein COCON_G00179190 [Conger conger]|uniref:Uncharacterized protein n=1 Tax=Conger conger TaxID=82655 RepID=A0A9Q1D612_CONCO|nr:hypothetical protein COCON_G00179190 [Conger conger]
MEKAHLHLLAPCDRVLGRINPRIFMFLFCGRRVSFTHNSSALVVSHGLSWVCPDGPMQLMFLMQCQRMDKTVLSAGLGIHLKNEHPLVINHIPEWSPRNNCSL